MPAALAFVPVAIGAAGTVGGLAAFAATTAGMFTIAGAALSAVGAITGDKGLATIGTLVSLGSSVVGMAGGAAGGAAEAVTGTAADTAAGAIAADNSYLAQTALQGGDPTAQALAQASENVETFGPTGGTAAEAAKAGQSAISPTAAMNGGTGAFDMSGSAGTGMPGSTPGGGGLIDKVINGFSGMKGEAQGAMINTAGSFVKGLFTPDYKKDEIAAYRDLNDKRMAIESQMAALKTQAANSSAGVKVGMSANTNANLYPNGRYQSPGGGFINRSMTQAA